MPELPEVETVRRGLTNLVKGAKIEKVDVPYPKVVTSDLTDFKKELVGTVIEKIDRRGKYLLFRLSNQATIVSHLRMEGQYSVEPEGANYHKHTEVAFHLADDRQLFYNDTRRFGRMTLVKTGSEKQDVSGLKNLGPEPTEEDLHLDYMKKIFGKSHRVVKSFLLDQSNIAGLGNIYADEVLWMSRIHPETTTDKLSTRKLGELRRNIIKEIDRATAHHGTTVHSFSNIYGETGHFQNELQVYGRAKLPCLRCGTTLKKIKVGQRGTTFCPKCQIKK
ncbi:bifunctional DNA-formamidopyrimidine glycosylase/DNA-(apurinic or apyrimidinic site) lyase [Fructobacillus sp. M158]|uniref:bifunctional DNA-formamidopyrimidine glycosylase/DNA-(apurinic or apyrimidinic site) lyase n=1 Tax=Fructobacillus parabroussonetiae TaxID=2713174 RepID=UPI00200B060A|nr:bifunctional DNA-formamidopyrimidine glycosylase/DNA-(apurinic or apyrimidinic site) lyase [Fructobacillus parabroussonetiae]MCK8617855.1 bifunctional DNA-formamidopyrimidine glycosylase/DNA-(apurinic or apyrimidinic site) lyase [Fructobacillus parabroussonetiae]